jgi:hypothetical protein
MDENGNIFTSSPADESRAQSKIISKTKKDIKTVFNKYISMQ